MSSSLSRREMISLVAGAALASTVLKAGEKGKEDTLRHSVCQWCFPKIPLAVLAEKVRGLSYDSLELLEPADWPVVQAAGLTCAVANGTTRIDAGLNRVEHHEAQVPSMIQRVHACAAAGIPNVICFSGNRGNLTREEGLSNCARALRVIVAEAEKAGVTVLMELLNSRVNHPDYQCDHTEWGVELVQRVGSPRFKLLYDIYHMQVMEGDLIATIRRHHECIGHYHTGGVPGRHEIGATQEIQYPAVMQAIRETGFRGFVAQEFLPVGEPFAALAEARRICG